jgi:hypothetical protein
MPDQTFTAGQILTAQQQTDLQTNIGLTFIKSQTFTSGTANTITNVFSSSFDSYKVIISWKPSVQTTGSVKLEPVVGGGTGYYAGGISMTYTGALVAYRSDNNGTTWGGGIVTGTDGTNITMEIHNPAVALFTNMEMNTHDTRVAANNAVTLGGGYIANTNTYTNLTFTSGTAVTSLTITVYGYRK